MTTTTPAEVREAVERVREIRQDLSAHLSQERPGDFVIRQHWVSEAEADITTLLAELARLTCAVGEVVELADAAEEFEESTERDRNNNRLLAAITRVRTAINPSKEDKADD